MPLIRKTGELPQAASQDSAAIFKALESAVTDERWKAARAAVDVPGAAVVLGKAIPNETDAGVREAMFTSVARSRSPESAEVLLTLLRSDNANLRAGALDAMRAMGLALLDKLPTILHDADSDIRVLSCELLRHFPSDAATPMLCGLLSGETDANVCAAVIDVLAEVGNTDALAVLAQCETRFRDSPFLIFSIKIAAERISSHGAKPRG